MGAGSPHGPVDGVGAGSPRSSAIGWGQVALRNSQWMGQVAPRTCRWIEKSSRENGYLADFSCSLQSPFHSPMDILLVEDVVDVGTLQLFHDRFLNTGKDGHRFSLLQMVDGLLQAVDAGGIDEGNMGHPEDDYPGQVGDIRQRVLELQGRPEEEGAIDLIHGYTFWQHLIRLLFKKYLAVDGGAIERCVLYSHGVTHPLHQNKGREDDTHLNRQDKVEDHRQQKGNHHDQHIKAIAFHQGDKLPPLTHVVGHDDEDPGEHSHGNHLDVGRKQDETEQKNQSVNDTGYRCTTTASDVGGGSGDCPGCRNSSKER